MAATIIHMYFCACCGEWLKDCFCPDGPTGSGEEAIRRHGDGVCSHPGWEKALADANAEARLTDES